MNLYLVYVGTAGVTLGKQSEYYCLKKLKYHEGNMISNKKLWNLLFLHKQKYQKSLNMMQCCHV